MTLWDWAAEVYGREGVAPACLGLQDHHGQSVPFLLWALWAGQAGRWPGDAALNRAAALARAWEQAATGPLRQARRAIKPSIADIDDAARESVRTQIKAVELACERALLQALESLAPATGEARAPAEALARAAAAWGRPLAPEALAALAAKLG
ncbi:MAG TPA: TIGR02444 family protein [Caulobacteraceae bacterium]|nr:TIGR02444 family protein [Caulobacteraceae bacterium]